jgi:hypothetical protein
LYSAASAGEAAAIGKIAAKVRRVRFVFKRLRDVAAYPIKFDGAKMWKSILGKHFFMITLAFLN